jgi:hypothetical protein
MAEMHISAVALTWMVIAGLGTVVALVALIFRQLSRLMTLNQGRALPPAPAKPPLMNELYRPAQGVLAEPAPSVTENTTRFFEPAYREPVERNK